MGGTNEETTAAEAHFALWNAASTAWLCVSDLNTLRQIADFARHWISADRTAAQTLRTVARKRGKRTVYVRDNDRKAKLRNSRDLWDNWCRQLAATVSTLRGHHKEVAETMAGPSANIRLYKPQQAPFIMKGLSATTYTAGVAELCRRVLMHAPSEVGSADELAAYFAEEVAVGIPLNTQRRANGALFSKQVCVVLTAFEPSVIGARLRLEQQIVHERLTRARAALGDRQDDRSQAGLHKKFSGESTDREGDARWYLGPTQIELIRATEIKATKYPGISTTVFRELVKGSGIRRTRSGEKGRQFTTEEVRALIDTAERLGKQDRVRIAECWSRFASPRKAHGNPA